MLNQSSPSPAATATVVPLAEKVTQAPTRAWINNAGEIAGQSYSGIDYVSATRAVAWDSSGQVHELPSLGWNYSVANAINDIGQLSGQAGPDESGWYPAVVWPGYNAAPIYLEKPACNGAGDAWARNNQEQEVGAVLFFTRSDSGLPGFEARIGEVDWSRQFQASCRYWNGGIRRYVG